MIDKGKTRLSPARFDCGPCVNLEYSREDDRISFSAWSLDIDVKDIPSPDSSQTPKMIFSNVGVGERVLLMWADLGPQPQLFQDSVEQVQKTVGKHHLATHSPVQLCQSYARICHQGQRGER